jgi:hypothetical protein
VAEQRQLVQEQLPALEWYQIFQAPLLNMAAVAMEQMVLAVVHQDLALAQAMQHH